MMFKELYQKSKKGKEDAIVIEGIHAFKHAARFGADFIDVVTFDQEAAIALMGEIASDEDVNQLKKNAREINKEEFENIASESLRTGVIAIAKKPQYNIDSLDDKKIIFVENPRDIDNVGAVVRVAAARGDTAVCVNGEISPWHMMAVRAGAGLQWAVPILHAQSIDDIAGNRKVYACDADGVDMCEESIERDAVLVFGTERDGISDDLKNHSDKIISIPMQSGVSSMNLATSVSAVLYGATFE